MPSNHLVDRCSCRNHREDILLTFDPEIHDKRPVTVKGSTQCRKYFVRRLDPHPIDTVRIGDLHKIHGREFSERVPVVIEKLLPLSHHAKEHVVQDNNLDRYFVCSYGAELLDIHLDAAVTGNIEDRNIRAGVLRSHCGREAVTHGSETSGGDPGARVVETEVLGGPHLVLAHF